MLHIVTFWSHTAADLHSSMLCDLCGEVNLARGSWYLLIRKTTATSPQAELKNLREHLQQASWPSLLGLQKRDVSTCQRRLKSRCVLWVSTHMSWRAGFLSRIMLSIDSVGYRCWQPPQKLSAQSTSCFWFGIPAGGYLYCWPSWNSYIVTRMMTDDSGEKTAATATMGC